MVSTQGHNSPDRNEKRQTVLRSLPTRVQLFTTSLSFLCSSGLQEARSIGISTPGSPCCRPDLAGAVLTASSRSDPLPAPFPHTHKAGMSPPQELQVAPRMLCPPICPSADPTQPPQLTANPTDTTFSTASAGRNPPLLPRGPCCLSWELFLGINHCLSMLLFLRRSSHQVPGLGVSGGRTCA